ncbi:MAG: hypothetical protein MUE32_04470 [Bacteroidales bacterium]|nr:hypothetical protein [Bacteroidales bacterium]
MEVKLDQFRLQLAEAISRIISSLLIAVIAGCIVFLLLLSLSVASGYFFADLLGSPALGFLCVAAFYAILLALFLVFRRHIVERPVIQLVIRLIFNKAGGDETK